MKLISHVSFIEKKGGFLAIETLQVNMEVTGCFDILLCHSDQSEIVCIFLMMDN